MNNFNLKSSRSISYKYLIINIVCWFQKLYYKNKTLFCKDNLVVTITAQSFVYVQKASNIDATTPGTFN